MMWLRIVESFALCPKLHQMQGPLHRTETSQMHQPAMMQARQMPGQLYRTETSQTQVRRMAVPQAH
jgi:hypothetical protein